MRHILDKNDGCPRFFVWGEGKTVRTESQKKRITGFLLLAIGNILDEEYHKLHAYIGMQQIIPFYMKAVVDENDHVELFMDAGDDYALPLRSFLLEQKMN